MVWWSSANRQPRTREDGAAPVEFVLVSLIFLPLVLGIIQVGLFLHVRNTLVACAQEGARKAANFDAGRVEGVARTKSCIAGAVNPRFAQNVVAGPPEGTPPRVEMRIEAVMPPMGIFTFGGPGGGLEFTVTGHAVDEPEQP